MAVAQLIAHQLVIQKAREVEETAQAAHFLRRQETIGRANVAATRTQHPLTHLHRAIQCDGEPVIVTFAGFKIRGARGPTIGGHMQLVAMVHLQRHKTTAGAQRIGRQNWQSGFNAQLLVLRSPAQAGLSQQADVDPHGGVQSGYVIAVIRDSQVVDEQRHAFLPNRSGHIHKIPLRCVQRLVEIDAYPSVGAQFTGEQQLTAQLIEPGLLIGRTQAERRATVDGRVQVEPQAHVVWPPRFFHRQDAKHIALTFARHAVVHTFVVAVAIGAQQVSVEVGHIQWLTHFLTYVPRHRRAAHSAKPLDLNGIHHHRLVIHLTPALAPRSIRSGIN